MNCNRTPAWLHGLLFVYFFFAYCNLMGQVTIQEKVTIVPRPRPGKGLVGPRSTSSVQSGFIMPKKGVVQAYYGLAIRLFTDFPPNASLIMNVRHGDTIITDPIGPRFRIHSVGSWTYYNSCSGDYENDSTEIYQSPTSPLTGPHVQAGDTVQFFYLTDGMPDTLSIASTDTFPEGWNVNFARNSGCITWAENLNIFVGVTDTTLTFTKPSVADTSVYPTYPGKNNMTDKNNVFDMELKVQFGDSLIKNYWVMLDSAVLVDSGGHSHDGNRPLGKYLLRRTDDTTKYDAMKTFTKQTDTTGVIRFKYVASQFGGIERIRARLLSDSTSFDTLRITTQVPGLVELPAGSNYILIGAPGDVDPCPHSPVTSLHYRNHFGTSALVQAVQNIANAYDSLSPGIILRINDMSLQKGGLFDIKNNWATPHSEHRLGTNADIGITGINQATVCVDLNLTRLRLKVRHYTGSKPLENEGTGPHFHIRMK